MGLIAGVLIVSNAARNLFFPVPIRLGTGIYLIAAAAVICWVQFHSGRERNATPWR